MTDLGDSGGEGGGGGGGGGSGGGSSVGGVMTINLLPYQHKQREAAQLAAIAQVSLCPCTS